MLSVLLGVLCGGALSPQSFLDQPQFLATHGGYSFFKVWINPALFRANQVMTDEVIASTCLAASRGTPPRAPCQSSSPICKYFSSTHCKATSEQGCDQPMLSTALQMGCSSAHDPVCRQRAFGSLVGTNGGCLWAHMGNAWGASGACGNCDCDSNAWNPAVGGSTLATCASLTSFCQEGRQYTTDGMIWPNCNPTALPGTPGASSCLTGGAMPAPGANWPQTQMEHWAFCVGRAVCKCVHGKCDISSEQGNCMLGTCGAGWSGPLCNEPCGPTFCLGRNDPSVTPPAGVVASAYNGVWTNTQNQCHCECLPQYGPSGAGPQGTVCGTCIQPGMLGCVAYTGTYLSSNTPKDSFPRSTQFVVNVDARFVQNDQIDTSITEIITVSKDPGGGNGDGGDLRVHTQNSQMMQGQVTMVMEFTEACDACYLTFTDVKGVLQPLRFGPIRVTSTATHLIATTSHTEIGVDDTVTIRLNAVDGPVGSAGNTDVTSPAVVKVRLQTVPDGGNGGGCGITAASGSALTQTLSSGTGEWRFKFGCSCNACVVIFEDLATTRTLPAYLYAPIKVSSAARSIGCVRTAGGACVATTIRTRLEVFSVKLQAQDAQGNLDTNAMGTISVVLQSGGGNGGGGQLQNAGGSKSLTQPLVNGEAQFDLSFTEACDSCILIASSSDTSLLPYTFPPIKVVTDALNLVVVNTVSTQLNVGQTFEVVVEARDSQGNRDTSWNNNVGATLLPNGGNGNGGQLQNADNSNSLVKQFVQGAFTYRLKFSASCTACIVEFTDVSSSNQRLNPVQLPAIFVGTTKVRMEQKDPLRNNIKKNQNFVITINTVDAAGDIDVNDMGRVSVSKQPGGGNGDGGAVTDTLGLTRDNVMGVATFTLSFSRACDACYLEFAHSSGGIPKLVVGPIEVTSFATKLIITTSTPQTIRAGEDFPLTAQAVDDDNNIDRTDRGTFSITSSSSGNNGDGGQLTNAGSAVTIQQVMNRGVVSWRPQFSTACQACQVTVRGPDALLGTVSTDIITVTTTVVSLRISPVTTFPRVTDVGKPIDVTVQAVDGNGNIATGVAIAVTSTLLPNGGNGNGSPFTASPVTRQTVNGEAAFRLTFGGACTACVVEFTHNATTLKLTLPSIEVLTTGRTVVVRSTLQTVAKGTTFEVPLEVVDEKSNTDTSAVMAVTATLRPNGGNGGGTPLTSQGGSQNFVGGKYTYRLSYGQACDACIIEFKATGLPAVTTAAMKVTTTTEKLVLTQSPVNGAPTARGVPFSVTVSAVDIDGNVNKDDRSEVGVQLTEVGPSGAQVPIAGLTGGGQQRLSAGTQTFPLTINSPCTTCTLTPTYTTSTGGAVNPSKTVYSLPAHDANLPPGSAPTASTSSDDSGTSPLIWVLLALLILLILLGLLWVLVSKLKGGKKEDTLDKEKEAPVEEDNTEPNRGAEAHYEPNYYAKTPPFEVQEYSPSYQQGGDVANPISEAFPSNTPLRSGDRPWMVDVASSPQGLSPAGQA
eukprot:TRINITY_DN3309_c2_g1_i2.p1 TRINITY_DN3309_c2_g1~~TRINITY_DN3309_c2_g1_i2.p1  ORF type:complete len:1492 (+),score=335.67 TRINITY_DN3309_c2_g1_i2:3175-7650(+)